MKWFYMVRGNCGRRGLVEEARLAELARTGQLGPDDLIWNEENGTCWVRASSLPGLFFKTESRKSGEKPDEAAPATDAPPVLPGKRANFLRWVLLGVAVLLLVIVIAILLAL